MRPPPSSAALARASASQSDSLLGLLALAKRICRLAADIDKIDRVAGRAQVVRSVASRNPVGTSDRTKSTASLCDFLCPNVGASDSLLASKDTLSRRRLRHGFPQHQQTKLTFNGSARIRSTRPYSQSRSASTATAAAKLDDAHVEQHSNHSAFSHDPFPTAAESDWQQVPDGVAPIHAPPRRSDGSPDHWLSPWQPSGNKRKKEDAQMWSRVNQALDEYRTDFRTGWKERSDTNGLNRRRLTAHRLWRVYQTYAHKERLSVAARITIADALVMSAHYTTTNKASSPQSKALRHLVGRRINAILQDCHFVRANRSTAASSKSSPSKWSDFSISLLQPISLALQAQPISALKFLDEVLLRSRPDIYRYETDRDVQGEFLSPIHTAMLTIIDSVDFEVNCRPKPQIITAAIRSQPHFFEDDGLLADLVLEGGEAPSELGDPIKKSLEWIMDSPHAFLLSRKEFRGARTSFFDCLAQVRDPHGLLDDLSQDRDPEQPGFSYACDLLLRSVLRTDREAAMELYDDLWSRGVQLPNSLVSRLILKSGGQAPAARLEALLHRVTNARSEGQGRASIKVLRRVAMAWAIRNRSDRVTALLAHLRRRSSKGHEEFARNVLAELAAARGDVQSVHTRLSEKYDLEARSLDDCAAGKLPLDGKAYALLIKACNRSDDVDLAEFYLTEALERGIPPRSSDFNLVIDMHVRKTNIDAALAIFDQMKEFGVLPDTYTYTILIHGFALRRDPESAAHALRAMIAAGKAPDRITYAALLNCFVESGLYDSAIRLFGWMQDQRDVRIRPTIEVCNIILKAYVLSSLPVQKVMKFVDSVRKLGLLPNASTYALMLQSACDAGLMDVAEEVFSEAEAALPSYNGEVGHGANIYHFTIMIHGYLRLGDQVEAKDYFDEMQSRKLTPSAITWSVMVHSYAHSENEANYDLACNLVSQLVADETKRIFRPSTWDVPATRAQSVKVQKTDRIAPGNRLAAKHSAPFETLYTVLMVAQAHRGEPDKVEQTLKTMSRRMPRLSVPTLTPLLDAYRRAGDIDSALGVFKQIYESALKSARSNSGRVYAYSQQSGEDVPATEASASQAPTRRRQDASSRNVLCLPISIMIDLLSTAGRHEEIAKMWARAKNDGFGFDSDNWNHLAASMARAGQLEEALSVVEHVLYRDPPNAWTRSRLGGDARIRSEADAAAAEAQIDKIGDRQDEDAADMDSLDLDSVDFDPLPADTTLDPAATHRSDATSAPSASRTRRHQNRADDDPYVDLPFERREPISQEHDDDSDVESTTPAPPDPYVEPSAFYLDSDAKLPYKRDLDTSRDSFSPWYAHFATMEAISRGLADLREASRAITLLDKYRTAAGLLDLHERKVEIIRERQREEAVRSARDLIDGRR